MQKLFTQEETAAQHTEAPASEIACYTATVRALNTAKQAR